MSLCTWHNATLFRRIWPQVNRRNDFNLRRLLKLLSAVAEEAGFTTSNLTNASTVGNIPRTAGTSVFNTDSYLLARIPTCKKCTTPLFHNVGVQKIFFRSLRSRITFCPPTFKTVAPPLGRVGQNRRLSTNNRLHLENGTR